MEAPHRQAVPGAFPQAPQVHLLISASSRLQRLLARESRPPVRQPLRSGTRLGAVPDTPVYAFRLRTAKVLVVKRRAEPWLCQL